MPRHGRRSRRRDRRALRRGGLARARAVGEGRGLLRAARLGDRGRARRRGGDRLRSAGASRVKRAAILCPGRGSYTAQTLASLPIDHAWVRRADELRRERGLPSLAALDRAGRFDPATHLAPANAAGLIWLVSMLDAAS